MKAFAAIAAALLAAGCAVDPYTRPPISAHLERSDDVGDCARLLRDVDLRVDATGVRDAGAPRVAGFPYLRVDRFTASLGGKSAEFGSAAFVPWSELMAQADRQARVAELANADATTPAAAIDACRYALAVADRDAYPQLREAARVPDDYSETMRALGLYPLTRVPFAAGIRDWQAETRQVFATPVEALPRAGPPTRYAPSAASPELAAPPRSAAFALPAPSAPQLLAWVQRHAPELDVDTAGDDDRIGVLVWAGADAPAIVADTTQPAAYVRTAYTHFAGRVRLQLVYTFWFPARPAEGAFDILAGRLDGLIWRVTLDDGGAPLVYDTIHPCGCYHMFFPTAAVAARPPPDTLDEGLLAPQVAPTLAAGERISLRVASRTHYLQRVTAVPAAATPGVAYSLRDEQSLRVLPWPAGGTRSAYDSAGFIAGTERAERWLYWPMGIASAGQMRQWGRHATAFVGRRHFDDAFLLDLYFEPRGKGATAGD